MLLRHFSSKPVLSAGILSALGMLCIYGGLLFNIQSVQFCAEGDGLKNHFLTGFHAQHGNRWLHFDGFQYPYGEHLLYTDSHPWLCMSLQLLKPVVNLTPYTVGIIQLGLLFSVVLAALLLARILEYKGWNSPWMGAWAAGIALLSSQALLWQVGHYSLAYVAAFPLVWWATLRWRHTPTWCRAFTVGLVVFWLFITHIYLGVLAVAFVGISVLIDQLQTRKFSISRSLQTASMLGIPLGLTWMAIRTLDTHPGRIEMPFVADHTLSMTAILTPSHGWSSALAKHLGVRPTSGLSSWEEIGCYLGAGVLLLGVVWLIVRLRTQTAFRNFSPDFFAAVLLAVFGFGIPFIWGLEEWMPAPLRQLVALGRFGWAAYFVVGVEAVVAYSKLPAFRLKRPLLIGATALLLAEGMGQHLELRPALEAPNPFHTHQAWDDLHKSISPQSYQAILPIPFYHKYISLHDLPGHPQMQAASMDLSLQTGLPLVSAFLSRPSERESRQILGLFHDHNAKSVLSLFDERPILVLSHDSVPDVYQSLLQWAQPIAQSGPWHLLKLKPQDIPRGKGIQAEFAQSAMDRRATSTPISIQRGTPTEIAHWNLNTLHQQPYTLKLAYYNRGFDQTFAAIDLEYQTASGHLIKTHSWDPAKTHRYHGNWAINHQLIDPPVNTHSLHLILRSTPNRYADTLQIQHINLLPPPKQN